LGKGKGKGRGKGTFLYQHYPKAKRYGRFPSLFCHSFLRTHRRPADYRLRAAGGFTV